MRRDVDAVRLLGGLLDRHERAAGGRRITAIPATAFGTPDERTALVGVLRAAESVGAVTLEWDRDAPHLIGRVVLKDADRLYRHLDRPPADVVLTSALAALDGVTPATMPALSLKARLASAWIAGGEVLGVGCDQAEQGVGLVRAVDAAFAPSDVRLPLRTRSARFLGDSKMLERNMRRLLAFARLEGLVDPSLRRDDALRALDLEKYPQPVLIAGPLIVRGAAIGSWAYAGMAAEEAEEVLVDGRLGAVVTVENLESFNRHARERRRRDEAVVYTGGFPGRGVVAALRRLVREGSVSVVHHWGDIDAGGVAIGRYLEQALPVPIRPHLMDPNLARRLGRPVPATVAPAGCVGGFAELTRFLASPDAHALEQEVLDPAYVDRADAT